MNQNCDRKLKLIDGSSNTKLAGDISTILDIPVARTFIDSFSDGETRVEIQENMRGCDVFVLQSTSNPVNEHLMQLCLILDALKRSNCWRVTAVLPYFGYARQDKKLQPRVPISAKAVADIIQCMGIDRVLTMDLHSNQIQGYFNCPVDNLFASTIFLEHMKFYYSNKNIVLVSPDVGGVARTVHYSKSLGVGAAIIHKSRENPNEVSEMKLLGDVKGKTAIIIDDMVDTAGTLCNAAEVLDENGAEEVVVYATHGVFSGDAFPNIGASSIDRLYITDSIFQKTTLPFIKVLGCSRLMADAINNIHHETSVSCLFG